MRNPLIHLLLTLVVGLAVGLPVTAQDKAQDHAKWRALLAEPIPANASAAVLRSHFEAKMSAADALPDYSARLAFYKAWNTALPDDKAPKVPLLALLTEGKKFDAATQDRVRYGASDTPHSGQLQLALNLYWEGRDQEAKNIVDSVKNDASRVYISKRSRAPLWGSPGRMNLAALGLAGALEIEARLQLRQGQFEAAIRTAEDGIHAAQQGLEFIQKLPPNESAIAAMLYWSREIWADLLLQKMRAQVSAGSQSSAARSLEEYLSLSRVLEVHPRFYWDMAVARYQQQEFVQAEAYFRKADQAAQALGDLPLAFFRRDCAQGILGALEGQGRWPDALAELERLDALAQEDDTLKYRIRFRFERAYAYVRGGVQLPAALELLQELAGKAEETIYRAHALGLQGVALWRMGNAEEKKTALPQLKEAVALYMTPISFDAQFVGLNTGVRNLVVATYLEALFQTPGENPMAAVAPAEWVRNSAVQNALADAAVRSSAKNPQLSALVRKDQDAKNEIKTLQRTISSEVETGVRERISELNILRGQLQADIKAQFPEYDRLVAPAPPDMDLAAKALGSDEVLVMLLPTEDSVYVWTLAQDGKTSTAQVAQSKQQLAKLVKDTRKTLDFAEMGKHISPFNAASASALYQHLLAPVQAALEGKKHVIIAAGGELGQIPFGVLLTQPTRTLHADAPWLIRQAAITHVPSLSAWLAVKQFAKADAAPEAFIAWGDPLFASIPALPETRGELLAIAAVLHADPERDLHLGALATKASVLQSNQSGELAKKKVIAFATHGLMAGDLPNLTQPALALARTGHEDTEPLGALLTLDEVLGLTLNADWVLLSACNTAAADGKAEEALSGLARGFFYAGSRSLLVTHWAVESESAKQLATATLASYAANPTERKAESLRQAMLQVMRDPLYAHPAYWAPYALVGDGGR